MARAKKSISEGDIIVKYMEDVLEHNEPYSNVFLFCKEHKIEEVKFYEHFSSLEVLEKRIWKKLMAQSITTVRKDEQFETFTGQEQLLSVLYTFFENLTLNRSYVLINLSLNDTLKQKFELFSSMKKEFSGFIDEAFEESRLSMARSDIKTLDDVRKKIYREGFWTQLKLLIEFWKKDESKSFESTDVAIEKSVRTAMDIIDASPRNSLIDLGKFIWKERMANH